MKQPLVTVTITTFNLEKFIRQTIESCLIQIVDFEFNIVVSDDGSTDATTSIVEEYVNKLPDKISLIKSEHIGKMPNFIRSLQAANGKYVALCDGDDYWTDPLKLQKQVDFMENNPDFTACYTNSMVINEVTGEQKIAKSRVWDVATTLELLDHNDFNPDGVAMSPGHTSTFMYRNFLVKEYPKWMYGDIMTDFPLYMIVSKYGKAKFINEITSVYRHHPKGVSTLYYTFEKNNRTRIHVLKCVNQYFDYKFRKKINHIISKHYIRLYKYYHNNNKDYVNAFIAAINGIIYNPLIILKLKK